MKIIEKLVHVLTEPVNTYRADVKRLETTRTDPNEVMRVRNLMKANPTVTHSSASMIFRER